MSLRVFVTGGAGYIGSHVVRQLGEAGYEPLIYDNLSTGNRWAVLHGTLAEGDLADRERLRASLNAFRPAALLHFAASIEVGESVRDPLKYYRNNTANALTLYEEALAAGVRHIVFSSTAAVYGEPGVTPIAETTPLAPINPYGASKAMSERLLGDLMAARPELSGVILRYFNVAGADPEARIGEAHNPETHIIPRILRASSNGQAIQLFGTDYPTPDGTCIRDYIHVEDLAAAHLLALRHLLEGGASRIFNCGYGHGYSVRAVIDAARRVTGCDVPVVEAPRRPGDPPELVADSRRIRAELGWAPRYDELDTILAHAWAWEQRLRQRS